MVGGQRDVDDLADARAGDLHVLPGDEEARRCRRSRRRGRRRRRVPSPRRQRAPARAERRRRTDRAAERGASRRVVLLLARRLGRRATGSTRRMRAGSPRPGSGRGCRAAGSSRRCSRSPGCSGRPGALAGRERVALQRDPRVVTVGVVVAAGRAAEAVEQAGDHVGRVDARSPATTGSRRAARRRSMPNAGRAARSVCGSRDSTGVASGSSARTSATTGRRAAQDRRGSRSTARSRVRHRARLAQRRPQLGEHGARLTSVVFARRRSAGARVAASSSAARSPAIAAPARSPPFATPRSSAVALGGDRATTPDDGSTSDRCERPLVGRDQLGSRLRGLCSAGDSASSSAARWPPPRAADSASPDPWTTLLKRRCALGVERVDAPGRDRRSAACPRPGCRRRPRSPARRCGRAASDTTAAGHARQRGRADRRRRPAVQRREIVVGDAQPDARAVVVVERRCPSTSPTVDPADLHEVALDELPGVLDLDADLVAPGPVREQHEARDRKRDRTSRDRQHSCHPWRGRV